MSTTETETDRDQDETTTNNDAPEIPPASGGEDQSIELDLETSASAGYHGILTTARCTGCKTVRRKLAPYEIADDGGSHPSFRHICHSCNRVSWYNTIEILEDVDDVDQEDDLDA